ncbi:MAG: hypothetical protein WCT10_03030 [Patescibacteria group bacterium]|jgi:hypothetical protein
MSLKTIVASVFALFLLAGCAPKFQVTVPEGWKVAKELNEEGVQAKLLVNAKEDIAIKVFCVPAEQVPVEEALKSTVDLVNQAQGQIVEQDLAADKSSSRVVFTVTVDGTDLAGRQVFKLSSYKHAKALLISSVWLAAQDAEAAKAFEIIAASADFK